jgi:hypothetical protein
MTIGIAQRRCCILTFSLKGLSSSSSILVPPSSEWKYLPLSPLGKTKHIEILGPCYKGDYSHRSSPP